MNRSSPYYHLKYRVDFQDRTQRGWEPIAAFNSDRAAVAYAKECADRDPAMIRKFGMEWRTMQRTGRGQWVELK